MDDSRHRSAPLSPLRASDYEAIESALMETARGRWFLSEFMSRNQSDDTRVLLNAIQKLEDTVKTHHSATNSDLIRDDLLQMSKAIADTRAEIAAMKPSDDENNQFVGASEELDAIVRTAEKATHDILQAAEDIQETAWVLREDGTDEQKCATLDDRAMDIYSACSFQDLTGQRTQKVVEVLRFLEARVNTMIEIWGMPEIEQPVAISPAPMRSDHHLLNGPQAEGIALVQDDIDDLMFVQSPIEDETIKSHERESSPANKDSAAASPEQDTISAQPATEAHIVDQLPPEPQSLLDQLAQNISQSGNSFLTNDPDDLLTDEEPLEASSPEQTEKPTAQNPTLDENLADDDVISAEDFQSTEPLKLSDLDPNAKTILFS